MHEIQITAFCPRSNSLTPEEITEREEQLKTWLKKYRTITADIDQLMEEISTLDELAEQAKNVQGQDGRCTGMVNELIGTLEGRIRELSEMRLYLQAILDLLTVDNERQVLYLHYVKGFNWAKVGETLFMDERWCRRLHARAIRRLAEMM